MGGAKNKGPAFGFRKSETIYLREYFSGTAVKAFYYTAYPAEGTRNYSLDGKHKFYTYLKKGLGFAVIKKELKRIMVAGAAGESGEEKGNMDVEMTIDALRHMDKYEVAALFTGDSDFLALVMAIGTFWILRKSGVRICDTAPNCGRERR